MEELCATFIELDMEQKFFQLVPYDTDDPDFKWHENVSDSSDCPRPQSSSSLSNEKYDCGNDEGNGKRQRKRQKSTKHHQEATHVAPEPEDTGTSNMSINKVKIEYVRRSLPPWKNESDPSDSDSDSSCREFVKRHRKSTLANSFNKDAANFEIKPLTNHYPSSGKTVKTIPSIYPISTETEPNYAIPTHISPVRKREQINQERNKTDFGYNRRVSLPCTGSGSRYTSEGESCNYVCKSPNKKFKKSPKFNRRILPPNEIMPCYKNYQLLGDSQLLRFSEQLLNCKPFVSYTEDTSSRRLGYCVSGQKIKDLEQRILKNELKLSDKLIILIGTNDMVYGTDLKSMCDSFDSMLRKLKENATRIVVLTVPPVPKLVNDCTHILKLKQFNLFLKNSADNQKVFLVDLASLYISYSNSISEQFFEPVIYKTRTNTKVDLIHLNRNGFKLLRAILDIEYFDKTVSF